MNPAMIRQLLGRAELVQTGIGAAAVVIASLSIIPLFVGLSWLVPTVVGVGVAAGGGALARALRLPAPLAPVVSIAVLWTWLAVRFVPEATALGFLPGPMAMGELARLARTGLVEADIALAPAVVTPPLLLLAVGGIGLVALAVDTLWLSARLPALAALTLFSLYGATSVMLVLPAPWWSFVPTAVGFALVLAFDQRDRVHAFDRHATGRGLGMPARLLGGIAIVAATVGVIVLPVRGVSPWHEIVAGDGEDVIGSSGDTLIDPVTSMRRSVIEGSDRVLLRYQTQARRPGYLRLVALEVYDGQRWHTRPDLHEIGIPLPGLVPPQRALLTDSTVATASMRIDIVDLANAYLPLPQDVSQVVDFGGMGTFWRFDPITGIAFSMDRPATGLAYATDAMASSVSTQMLHAATSTSVSTDMRPQLALPSSVPDSIAILARDVTRGANGPYEQALALQRWFTRDGGFTYSTNVTSSISTDYLMQFLDERIGYCEQFAGAMAIMARTLGIPSRVVVGFTQGTRGEETGTWLVRAKDAHAWPELWFEGAGWVRFEPTPASSSQPTVSAPDYAPNAPTNGSASADRIAGGLDAAHDPGAFDSSLVSDAPVADTAPPLTPVLLVLVVLAALLAALPGAGRAWVRRHRLHAEPARELLEGSWREIADSAVDTSRPWHAYETSRRQAARLAGSLPDAADAIWRVQAQLEQARYAPPADDRRGSLRTGSLRALPTEHADAVRSDVRVIRRAMLRGLGLRARAGVYAWPSSWRWRQRSSIRSMNPFVDFGAGRPAGAEGASGVGAGMRNAE